MPVKLPEPAKARAREILQRGMTRGGERAAALEAKPAARKVMLRAVPQALEQRFDAVAAGDLDAAFGLAVRDPAGGAPDRFTITVKGGACTVRRGEATAARANVEIAAGDMIRLVSGSVGWPALLAEKRLAMSGDVFLVLRFPQLFRLPAASA